jgi:hypothetical protein
MEDCSLAIKQLGMLREALQFASEDFWDQLISQSIMIAEKPKRNITLARLSRGLIVAGQWQRAKSIIPLLLPVYRRIEMLLELIASLEKHHEGLEIAILLKQSVEQAHIIEPGNRAREVLWHLFWRLGRSRSWKEAEELVRLFPDREQRWSALRMLALWLIDAGNSI